MDTTFRQALKAKAHALKPVVLLGSKGLTPAVIQEINVALEAHELIKVKLKAQDKEERIKLAEDICAQLNAEVIQHIGSIVILYRKKKT